MILYKLASRGRPDKLKETVSNLFDNVETEFHLHISLDCSDRTIDFDWLRSIAGKLVSYDICDNKTKIEAINRNIYELVKDYTPDIIVNHSDDMKFIVKGFDKIIREHCGPDDFVHFPDGNRSDLATMSIIGYEYFLRDQYIYHESYKSLWCDNEAQDVAKKRGRYKFVPNQIFEHRHPAYGKATMDTTYVINESYEYNNHDRLVYESRRNENFGINTND